MMLKYQIERWMDNQIDAQKKLQEKLISDDKSYVLKNLSAHAAGYSIQLTSKAVRYIATFGFDLCVSKRVDCEDPYEVFILYNGYKFFAIETEEEYQKNGAVV